MTFVRSGKNTRDDLVCLINFDPASYPNFKIGVPREGDYKIIFNSDRPEYGGSGYSEETIVSSKPEPWNGQENSIEIRVPGLAGLVLKRQRKSSYKPPKKVVAKKSTAQTTKASASGKTKATTKAKTASKKTRNSQNERGR